MGVNSFMPLRGQIRGAVTSDLAYSRYVRLSGQVGAEQTARAIQFRRRKDDPPMALIEQAVVPTFLSLTPNAVRVYVTLCRFANGKSALSYPSRRKLLSRLGGVPYHTDFLTGRTKVGLTKAQRETRTKQLHRWGITLDECLAELIRARLIAPKSVTMRVKGSDVSYDGFQILRPADGHVRRIRDLKHRHAFFIVPGWLFDIGAFAIWHPNARRFYQPVGDKDLRVMTLALRDNDDLRYGGVNSDKVTLIDGDISVNPAAWPVELTFSVSECATALHGLLKRKIIKPFTAVYSSEHDHLIDARRDIAASPSEVVRTLVRIA